MENPHVAAYITDLQDENYIVRWNASIVLGKIGDASAVPSLMEALKDKNEYVRKRAAFALERIGDSDTLPRKILAVSQWSAQERINVLEKLRRVRYNDLNSRSTELTLRYTFPETRTLCQLVMNEADADARTGARAVFNWLNGDRHLLHASQADTSKQSHELVRPARRGDSETKPETLLRTAHEPESAEAEVPPQPTIWKRISVKRKGTTS
jgi:hypothetical protein